jgi:hypothetical protein
MYGHGHFTAFTGFAVAADSSGVFAKLGVVGPVLQVMHFVVGALLVVWLVAFAYALVSITVRRLGRTEVTAPARVVLSTADSAS